MPSDNALLRHPGALCNTVRRMALEAGAVILRHFEADEAQDIEKKPDGSPVSRADREAEEFILGSLAEITPGIPLVGEEAASSGKIPDIGAAGYFWLVDPLDGTKEFISGSGDFTVNIALIQGKTPLLGVVYAPARGELYAGHGPGTAVRWLEDSGKDKTIHVRRPPAQGLTVMASGRHGDNARLDNFLGGFKVEKLLRRGSSLKICMIAEAKADLYPRLGPTCQWDTAAADAVLRAAGGWVTDLQGKPLVYEARPGFLNPEFVASSFDWWSETS